MDTALSREVVGCKQAPLPSAHPTPAPLRDPPLGNEQGTGAGTAGACLGLPAGPATDRCQFSQLNKKKKRWPLSWPHPRVTPLPPTLVYPLPAGSVTSSPSSHAPAGQPGGARPPSNQRPNTPPHPHPPNPPAPATHNSQQSALLRGTVLCGPAAPRAPSRQPSTGRAAAVLGAGPTGNTGLQPGGAAPRRQTERPPRTGGPLTPETPQTRCK